jgi:hypothetical protein
MNLVNYFALMKRPSNPVLRLLLLFLIYLLAPLDINAQCEQYNLSISYDKQFMHRTPELAHNDQFSYVGIWYTDSIAINQKKYTRNTSPDYKCLIIKIDKSGNIVAQVDLILPMPYTNPNLRLDPITGGLVYVLTTYNQVYKINSSLSIDATKKSVLGIVRIDSNLNNIGFSKIAESLPNERFAEGENDIHVDQNGGKMMVIANKKMLLNNGDTISPQSNFDVYSLDLNTQLLVKGKTLLVKTGSRVTTCGIVNSPVGLHYFLKFIKSASVPSINKSYLAALNKTMPGAPADGSDILIIKELKNKIVASYSIGCTSTVVPIGLKNCFFYANERFYFPHSNAGQNLYDDKMRLFSTSIADRNALAIFDTSFTLTNLKAFEDKSEYTNVGLGFFKASLNEFVLTANTDSVFSFNGKTYTPQTNANPTYMNVIFDVKGDSIYYKWSQNTENRMCFFTDFTPQSASFNLYTYPNKTISTTHNMTLEKPLYKQFYWMVKICLPDVRSKEIETNIPRCYPNPLNQGILHVDAAQPIQSITVMTMQGQVVFEQLPNAAKTVLNLENLPAGNYLVRTQSSNHSTNQKIIILR